MKKEITCGLPGLNTYSSNFTTRNPSRHSIVPQHVQYMSTLPIPAEPHIATNVYCPSPHIVLKEIRKWLVLTTNIKNSNVYLALLVIFVQIMRAFI
jgi:hypothetical protein